jgi:hypothetical protein
MGKPIGAYRSSRKNKQNFECLIKICEKTIRVKNKIFAMSFQGNCNYKSSSKRILKFQNQQRSLLRPKLFIVAKVFELNLVTQSLSDNTIKTARAVIN